MQPARHRDSHSHHQVVFCGRDGVAVAAALVGMLRAVESLLADADKSGQRLTAGQPQS